jgi:hypothetical protein
MTELVKARLAAVLVETPALKMRLPYTILLPPRSHATEPLFATMMATVVITSRRPERPPGADVSLFVLALFVWSQARLQT